jgi:hypothetical protein
MTHDLKWSGPEIITAYSWRFKIEVSFRTLVHLLDGFAYRFWLKSIKKMGHQFLDRLTPTQMEQHHARTGT